MHVTYVMRMLDGNGHGGRKGRRKGRITFLRRIHVWGLISEHAAILLNLVAFVEGLGTRTCQCKTAPFPQFNLVELLHFKPNRYQSFIQACL